MRVAVSRKLTPSRDGGEDEGGFRYSPREKYAWEIVIPNSIVKETIDRKYLEFLGILLIRTS